MSDVLALATLIGVSAAVIGVFAAVLQLRELSNQRRRDFENLFVQRYWKIMDDLSLEAIECTTPDGGAVSAKDKKAVIAFLMWSEDELELRWQWTIGERLPIVYERPRPIQPRARRPSLPIRFGPRHSPF